MYSRGGGECRINRFGLLVRIAAAWGGPNQGGLKVKPAFSETSISSQARLHKRSEKKCLVSQGKKMFISSHLTE